MRGTDYERSNTDVTVVLAEDHRTIEQLLEALAADSLEVTAHRVLMDRTIIEVVQHSVAEELFLFPAVREYVPGGAKLADHELENHAEVDAVMKVLDLLNPTDGSFKPQVSMLRSLLGAHIAYEERVLFPALLQATAPQFRDEIGEKILVSKSYGPTRPHPNAPNTPPGNLLLAAGTGLVDRVRDAFSHRGQG